MATCNQRDDARVRNIRKKLAQITALEDKLQAEGLLHADISAEQRAKLDRKEELELELRHLMAASDSPGSVATTAGEDSIISEASSPAPSVDERHPTRPKMAAAGRPATTSTPEKLAAVAVCQDLDQDLEEVPQRPRLMSNRWEDDPLAVEDVTPAPEPKTCSDAEAEILEAVQPFGPASQADLRLRRLVRATSELSQEAFESDVLEGVSRKGKWKLTLLVQPREHTADNDPWHGLLGFIAYKLKPQVQCVSIAKLAVVPEQRGRGHGHKLVQWCITMAKKQPNIIFLSLTSLPQAIKFYKRIGFRQVDVDLSKLDTNIEDDEEYVEGQVYMEYRCKGRGGPKRR